MEDLKNETISQVRALVDLVVEQQSIAILDNLNDLNDPNFCGFTFLSTFVGYVGSFNITSDANFLTIVITNETLWSLFVKQKDF